MVGMSITEVIFTVRVWAVLGRSRRSTFLLPIFFIMCWLPAYVIVVQAVSTAKFKSQDLIPRGCLVTDKISTIRISVAWGILLVYDMVIMTCMLIPAVNAFKQNGMSQLTSTMYRDGIIYYIFLFILSLANLIINVTMPPDYFDLVVFTGRVIRANLACRVVLHLREVGQRNEDELCTSITHEIRFTRVK
ncbi:hypothetical protein BDQ17DRAFT_1284323 [Cyathus striatus]|nr:hypothetical protein BDQ17DRAFT_1284323 [Cyathus striatus]